MEEGGGAGVGEVGGGEKGGVRRIVGYREKGGRKERRVSNSEGGKEVKKRRR